MFYIFNITLLGNLINELTKKYDFSSKNLYLVSKIIKNSNGSKINPNHFSKICPTTGLVTFFVKEPLEYTGLLLEKKTNPSTALLTYQNINKYLEELKIKK